MAFIIPRAVSSGWISDGGKMNLEAPHKLAKAKSTSAAWRSKFKGYTKEAFIKRNIKRTFFRTVG